MIFTPTRIPGAWIVDIEAHADERGFFARTWCADEFAHHGLVAPPAQCSVSFNTRAGTLRGMHWQVAPHGETKLVRCTGGAIHDVIVDMRPGSPTRGRWLGVDLTARNHRMLFIPEGCAHGFITLEDDSEVAYQITGAFAPAAARGVRWDDPGLGIEWPARPTVVSERDRTWPDLER